jgi:peptidoglycan/LPS O-acetylase OafA/YrhL
MSTAKEPVVGGYLPALDGVRGLAILVVLTHNVGYFDEPADSIAIKLLRAALGGGWAGVQLFFVLSGFLITGILLDGKRDAHYFQSFYLRHMLRIFPIYYLTLIGAFVVFPHVIDLGQ